jgi:hypothetical protein
MRTLIVNFILIIAALLTIPAQADAQTNTYDEIFATVDWMAKKYELGTVWVGVEPMEDATFGYAGNGQVTFNSRWVYDPAGLDEAMAYNVATGVHPGANCTAAQSIAVHETAHIIDERNGHEARYEALAVFGNGSGLHGELSSYSFDDSGYLNPGEALANAVLAVECDTPTAAELTLYEMLTT